MKCVLYARVSTDRQVEKDLSIPAQLRLMRAFAVQKGWTIVEEIRELGLTARNSERPALQGLLARIQSGELKIDIVLTHKLNRMSRDRDDYSPIRTILKKHGARITSVVENIDDSPAGQFLENIMVSLAQFESANLGDETKKGMRQKVLSGGWPHKPPRGYITIRENGKSRIEIHPRVGPLVQQAFRLYATGWYSIEAVATRLLADGLMTSSGHRISKADLHRILTNRFYLGRLKWADLDVEGTHPKLISPELFEKVQRVTAARFRERGRRQSAGGLPLRGLAICASCRGRITGEWHKRWAYYRCSRQSYRREVCNARLCAASRAHADLKRICVQVQIKRSVASKIEHAALKEIATRTSRERIRGFDEEERVLMTRRTHLTQSFLAGELGPADYETAVTELGFAQQRLEGLRTQGEIEPAQVLAKVRQRLEIATSIWDLYERFDDGRRVDLLRAVFQSVVMTGNGISGYVLNPPFDRLPELIESDEDYAKAAGTLLDAA